MIFARFLTKGRDRLILTAALPFVFIFFSATSSKAQQTAPGVVSGSIYSIEKGVKEPAIGAAIKEKGTSNGVSTNAKGEYSIKVNSGATLVVSLIGYTTTEIKASKLGAGFNIELKTSTKRLQEVEVVSNGFQQIDRKLFTGAATKISGADANTDGTLDVSRALEGKVAGVSIQNISGTFGTAPKIRIRSATSLKGDNKPLWVIDGVVLEDIVNITSDQLSSGDPNTLLGSPVAGLNPSDIESFEILKDAAATGLYGARAANGVVVVTTKKGRAGKLAINYSGVFTTRLKPTYRQYDILNSNDQFSVYKQFEREGYLNISDVATKANAGIYGRYSDLIRTVNSNGSFGIANTPEAQSAFLEPYRYVNTNWFDVLYKNSVTQEHAINLSGGSENSTVYASINVYSDPGWSIADKVNRYIGNIKANFNVGKKLQVGVITLGSYRNQGAPGTVTRQSNTVEGRYDREFDINPFSYSLNTSRTVTAYERNGKYSYFRRNFAPFNIIDELNNNKNNLDLLDFKVQTDLKYNIIKGLDFSALGALRYVKSTTSNEVNENSNEANAYRANQNAVINADNSLLYLDPDNVNAPKVVILPQGGILRTDQIALKSYNLRYQLSYNKLFGANHSINLFAGQEIRQADRVATANTGYGYLFNSGGIAYIDSRAIKQETENNKAYYTRALTYNRFVGIFSNASYSYKGKYSLSLTGRYDGTNQLGSAARYLPTWNVSGKWNILEENFLKNFQDINLLQIRGTYGLTASLGQAPNSRVVYRNGKTPRAYASENELGLNIEELENSEITWEKQYEKNLGIDAGFFNSRLVVTVDGYQRRGFDLINVIRTSGVGGQEQKTANAADLKTTGFDATLTIVPIRRTNFEWKSIFTIGYNKNKITRANNVPEVLDLVQPEGGIKQGYAQRGLFSLPFLGLDHDTGLPNFRDETGQSARGVYVQGTNTDFLKYEGSVDPRGIGGWNNSFRYRHFTVRALFTYQFGNKIRLNPLFGSVKNNRNQEDARFNDLSANTSDFLNRWVLPGDELKTTIPVFIDRPNAFPIQGQYYYQAYDLSDQRVASGSFIRLKTITLEYILPQNLIQLVGMKTGSISASSNDLWLVASDKKLRGRDPEFFESGGVAQPLPKQITMAIKFGF